MCISLAFIIRIYHNAGLLNVKVNVLIDAVHVALF
jgi:hypothetical protein